VQFNTTATDNNAKANHDLTNVGRMLPPEAGVGEEHAGDITTGRESRRWFAGEGMVGRGKPFIGDG
jgi:hypothetical protein